jgi:16S rRNA C1402 N4-methylase RsmH
MGRLDMRMAVTLKISVSKVIAEYNNDVGLSSFRIGRGGGSFLS